MLKCTSFEAEIATIAITQTNSEGAQEKGEKNVRPFGAGKETKETTALHILDFCLRIRHFVL